MEEYEVFYVASACGVGHTKIVTSNGSVPVVLS